MAEPLGAVASGMTNATLSKTCLAPFDLVQHARNQDADLHKLTITLNLQKARLWQSGGAMGSTEEIHAGQPRAIDASPFKPPIFDTLQATIIDTFNDTQK